MSEYTSPREDELRRTRRSLIARGIPVSLMAYDPARDVYVFDAAEPPTR